MKMWKKLLSTLLALALALTCFLTPDLAAKADTDTDRNSMYDANGLFFGTSHYGYDNVYVDANGKLNTQNGHYVYLNKLRLVKEKGNDYYPQGDLNFVQNDSVTDGAAELISVKSSNKNLKCIISENYSSTRTMKWNDEVTPYSSSDHYSTVTVLAKKAGTYTVTATIRLKDGKLVTKAATVKVENKQPISIVPDEKKLSMIDGTFDAKSLKVKIVKGKTVSAVTSYYSNTLYAKKVTEADGYVSYPLQNYKKFKSGKKIKLNTKTSGSYTNVETASTTKYTDNFWYAPTYIAVLYKDTFYGVYDYTTTTIYRYKKLKK